jgi:DNA-directed RNA polymerase specialized sigma24 family protein
VHRSTLKNYIRRCHSIIMAFKCRDGIEEIANMTREAYGEAYKQGVHRTIRLLRSRGAGPEMAADMAQSAWLRGWERLSQLRDERIILTWINTIALNQHRDAIRTVRLWQEIDERHAKTSVNLAAIDVARVLCLCRPSDRALLSAQIEGVTMKELAAEKGVTETAIKIRLLRARRSARLALEKSRKIRARAHQSR